MPWTQITETVVGGGGAAVVTFLAIPQTYRVLVLMSNVRTDLAAEADNFGWRANNDAGNNYDYVYFLAAVTAHVGGGARAVNLGLMGTGEGALTRANCFGPNISFWYDYASAAAEKTVLTISGGVAGDRSADADLLEIKWSSWWRSIAAITRLDFIPQTGPNFVQGSRFTLYGIT